MTLQGLQPVPFFDLKAGILPRYFCAASSLSVFRYRKS